MIHNETIDDLIRDLRSGMGFAPLALQQTADDIETLRAQVAALTAERDAAAGAVRVKPLAWKGMGENHARAAAPLFGTIRVENYGAGFAISWSVPGFSDVFCDGRWPTIEAAKAAAQADYEARILAALEPAPVSDEALIRAALEAAHIEAVGVANEADDHQRHLGAMDVVDAIRALATPEGIAVIRERAKE